MIIRRCVLVYCSVTAAFAPSVLTAQSFQAADENYGSGTATAILSENRDNSPRRVRASRDIALSAESNVSVLPFDAELQVIEVESLVYGIPAIDIFGVGDLGIPGDELRAVSFDLEININPLQVSLKKPSKLLAREIDTKEWATTGLTSNDFEVSQVSGSYSIDSKGGDMVRGDFLFDASALSFDNRELFDDDEVVYDRWFVDDGEWLADTYLRQRGITMKVENTTDAIYTGILEGVAVKLFMPSYSFAIPGLHFKAAPVKVVMIVGDSNNDGVFNSRDLVTALSEKTCLTDLE